MPTSKLKNLSILVLLLANLCLLAVILPIHRQQQREQENLRLHLSNLYAREELHLSPELIPDTEVLYALQLSENSDADLHAALALLGEQVLVQDDSTRYLRLYKSQKGSCSIGQDGSFNAALTGSTPCEDLGSASRETLQAMGFVPFYLGQPSRMENGTYVVQTSQSVLGVPIFSEGLTLTYAQNVLTAVDGTFYTGVSHLTRVSEEPCLNAADALVKFLSARFNLGWMGSEISSMEQGYLRTEIAAAATVHLVPVWRLGTDTGSFYINGLTGDVTSISG